MANVVLDKLTRRYPDNVAVNELSLDVKDGEFLVLVGPSGCGKTTALRMIAGLEEISDGKLLIDGKVVNNSSPRDRDIAMVFQSYALYPHMTVFDNMGFGLQLRKRPKDEIEKAVTEAARILDLETYLHRKPGQLSGGQRQRVALGRAIVRDPAAFLMDEPLSNLDAKLRVQTRAEIARLHQRLKATIIYVTHDQVEAMTMGDRIAVMQGGVLQQVGTPRDLYERPDNLFVAGFIGSPSMNFVDVEVSTDGDGAQLSGTEVKVTLTQAQSAVLKASGADRVTIGVRPEHLGREPVADGVTLDAGVEVVEYLGHEELLHLRSGQNDIVAILDSGHGADVGTDVSLHAPADLLHIFDRDSGKVIRAA